MGAGCGGVRDRATCHLHSKRGCLVAYLVRVRIGGLDRGRATRRVGVGIRVRDKK